MSNDAGPSSHHGSHGPSAKRRRRDTSSGSGSDDESARRHHRHLKPPSAMKKVRTNPDDKGKRPDHHVHETGSRGGVRSQSGRPQAGGEASPELQLHPHAVPSMQPSFDMHLDGEAGRWVVTVELPGMAVKDVDIHWVPPHLVVHGMKRGPSGHESTDYAVSQRKFGPFSISIPLPVTFDIKDATADMGDGLLTITYPQEAPVAEVTNIPVLNTHSLHGGNSSR